MDTRVRVLIAMLLAASSSVQRVGAQASPRDSVWRALPCSGTAKTYSNGQLQRCVLAIDAPLGEFQLPAGSVVELGRDVGLVNVHLARETSFFGGEPLPAKTMMIFFGDGGLRSFWLHSDAVIQGYLLGAQRDGIGNMLHPTGKLRSARLARDQVIDGVPCTSRRNPFQLGMSAFINGDNAFVFFHPDGRLRQCRLSRTATVAGLTFQRGDLIRLRPDGTLDSAPDDQR